VSGDAEIARRRERMNREFPFGHQQPEPEDWDGREISDYERMLNSYEWKWRSHDIKKRDNFICQQCESPHDLEVHHLKYTKSRPWEELGENLTTLCSICHHAASREKIHGAVPAFIQELVSGLIKDVKPVANVQDQRKLQAQLQWASDIVHHP